MPKQPAPPTAAPPLHEDIPSRRRDRPPRRRQVTADVPDPGLAAHEKQREQAYHAEHHWRGAPLKPFTYDRRILFYELSAAADAPTIAQVRKHPQAFLGDAVRLLFLCAHEPEDFLFLRGNKPAFLRAVDLWAMGRDDWRLDQEESPAPSPPRITIKEELAAIKLALQILNEAEISRAEAAPADHDSLGE